MCNEKKDGNKLPMACVCGCCNKTDKHITNMPTMLKVSFNLNDVYFDELPNIEGKIESQLKPLGYKSVQKYNLFESLERVMYFDNQDS